MNPKAIMDLNHYQRLATRTGSNHLSRDAAMCSWAMGLCGEAGEASEIVKKHVFHGKPLDVAALRLELGDVLWYLAMQAHQCGLTLEEVAAANIEKLERRYPDGFKRADEAPQ